STREHAGIPLLLGSRGSGSSVWNPGGHRATAATQAGRTPAPDGRAPDADGSGEARHLSRTVGACPQKPAVGRRTAPLCPRVSVRGHWLRVGAADVATGGSIRSPSATRGLSARPAPDGRPARLAAACAGTDQDATSTGAERIQLTQAQLALQDLQSRFSSGLIPKAEAESWIETLPDSFRPLVRGMYQVGDD